MALGAVNLSLKSRLYAWILHYADHPRAVWVLNGVSFAESSFFPFPPDLLMIPMILVDRARAWWLAFTCGLFSVAGGLLGYTIGYFLYETIGGWIIQTYGLGPSFERFQADFQTWGFWLIVAKGLTPIPYKLITIASGVVRLNLSTFILASFIARFFRFFLLSALVWFLGPRAKHFVEKYLGWLLVASLAIIVAGFMIVKFLT